MTRVRIALAGAMAIVLALWAGDVFDERVWSLLVAGAAPAVLVLLTHRARWFVRLPAAGATIAASVFAIAVIEGGGIGDLGVAATSGLRRVLSTEWPSPVRPDLVATIALVVAIAATASAELAGRTHLRLAPVGPIALGAVAVISLSSPGGPSLAWPVLLGLLVIVLAALGPDGPVRDRLRLLRGERRLAAMVAVVAVITTGSAIVLDIGVRADPRETEEPDRTSALLDPIEATLALQRIEPSSELHVITLGETAPNAPAPTRWRTAALTDYDGRRWTPDLVVRPIGRRLAIDAPADDPQIDARIEFRDDDLQLVPLPGRPVIVDAPIETDEDRTIVRLVDRPSNGTTVTITALIAPDDLADLGDPIASREVDDSVSGLSDLAADLADVDDGSGESTTMVDRLRAIEQTMRDDFVLDPDAAGGGLQRALIERFLRETRRGNEEQFATGFVLLARSIGADARVATGFVVDPTRVTGSTVTITSSDAAIWPEVRAGEEWVAFDPVPDVERGDETEPPAEPTVQSPAAPQPPIAPPPDDTDGPVDNDDVDDTEVADGVSTVVELVTRGAVAIGIVLVPVLLAVAVILATKWRRRRRRLRGAPSKRIRGAWLEATDHLVDAGMSISPAMTNGDIARAGHPWAPAAARELDRLAVLSTAATFGDPVRPDLLADDAVTCLAVVERSVDLDRPVRARARRRLSLRSLRSATRSPV